MKLAPAAFLIPFVALAQDGALFDDVAPADASSSPAPAPFSEWDGVTQFFPAPHAKSKPHAESAESAELNLDLELVDTGGQLEFVDNPTIPSLSLVGEFELDKDAPEGLSGIAWTSNPGHPEIVDPDPFGRAGGPGPRFDICTPDSYVLCEDSGAWLDFAEIGIDRASGAITSAVFRLRDQAYFYSDDEPLEMADFEAIAYARSRHDCTHYQLYVSDEAHPYVWQDRLEPCTTGVVAVPSPIVAVSLPEPLRGHRRNKGVEAMCLSPDDRALWLALEDAHPEDGPVATTEHGALVRLVRMDAIAGASEAQLRRRRSAGGAGPVEPAWWFYELDPAAGGKMPHLPDPFNGLAELCALPDGRLLALERTYGLRTRSPSDPRASLIAISIYLVDPLGSAPAGPSHAESNPHAESAEPGGASSPSEPGSPVGGAAERCVAEGVIQHSAFSIQHSKPSPLPKILLWKGLTGRANYEGMTLGPELADGSRALILVSDGDVTRKGAFAFPWSKRLLSFRLRLADPPAAPHAPRVAFPEGVW